MGVNYELENEEWEDSSKDLCCLSSSLFLEVTAFFSENSCYLHFDCMYLAK